MEPVLPEGWTWNPECSVTEIIVPARTDGWVDPFDSNPDRFARIRIAIAANAAPQIYVIPFRITWDGRYLGQFRDALVRVTG